MRFKSGFFSDAGYRFRENTLNTVDHWIPFILPEKKNFYDISLFSSDTLQVSDEYNVICEMWFRIKTDAITHSRNVFGIMNWLGSIGGVNSVLIEIMGFFFCGFAEFNCSIESLKFLDQEQVNDEEELEES